MATWKDHGCQMVGHIKKKNAVRQKARVEGKLKNLMVLLLNLPFLSSQRLLVPAILHINLLICASQERLSTNRTGTWVFRLSIETQCLEYGTYLDVGANEDRFCWDLDVVLQVVHWERQECGERGCRG